MTLLRLTALFFLFAVPLWAGEGIKYDPTDPDVPYRVTEYYASVPTDEWLLLPNTLVNHDAVVQFTITPEALAVSSQFWKYDSMALVTANIITWQGDVIEFDPADATVANRVTSYRKNVARAPHLGQPNTLVNYDSKIQCTVTPEALALLQKYWKYDSTAPVTANIIAMSAAEQAAVDAEQAAADAEQATADGVPRPNTRRWAMISAMGTNGPEVSEVADDETILGTRFSINATSADPTVNRYRTGAVTGNDAGTQGNPNYIVGRNILFQSYVKIGSTLRTRAFVGVTTGTLVNSVGSDNPAGHYAAFQYQSELPRDDTNWQCVTKDGTTQNVSDSGTAVGTVGIEFEIEFRDAIPDVVFSIDGIVVCTETANLPATNQRLRYVFGIETQTSTFKDIFSSWIYLESDK